MSAPPLISLRDVSAGYHGREVLHAITLDVARGCCAGLIGPNGAGKTTLLRVLSGALRPRRGTLRVGGDDLHALPARQRARRIAFVPQALHISVPLRVSELVAVGRTPHLGGWASLSDRDRAAIESALRATDLLDLREARYDEMSAGEQQRALVALALAQDPEIILMDEPTAHVDIRHAWALTALMRRLCAENGLTVILSSHDLVLAAEFCAQILLLDRGHPAAAGPPAEVFQPNLLSRIYGHPLDIRAIDGRLWIRPV